MRGGETRRHCEQQHSATCQQPFHKAPPSVPTLDWVAECVWSEKAAEVSERTVGIDSKLEENVRRVCRAAVDRDQSKFVCAVDVEWWLRHWETVTTVDELIVHVDENVVM